MKMRRGCDDVCYVDSYTSTVGGLLIALSAAPCVVCL